MDNKHIGSTFDSWLEEEGILNEVNEVATEEIKHKLRIRMNEIRNQIIETHRKITEMSPEEKEESWKNAIGEWCVQHNKINIFNVDEHEKTGFREFFSKFV